MFQLISFINVEKESNDGTKRKPIIVQEDKMVKRIFPLAIFLLVSLLVFTTMSQGSTLVENKDQNFSFQNKLALDDFEHSQRINGLTQSPYWADAGEPTEKQDAMDVYAFKGKSIKRAFLYSMIIPGSGEFYANSKLKAVAFFGADVALWGLYFSYHGKGKDKEKEYRNFADAHWFKEDYTQWLIDSLDITTDTMRYWDDTKNEWTYLSHHLPDTKTQQYYEMVGKYEQFRWGWEDYSDLTKTSVFRNTYVIMRKDSNDWLKKAKNAAAISIANHILSAFDAAWSVRKYNKKGERFSQLEIQTRFSERNNEIIPQLTVSMKF
jgi:hypothetical protein